MTRNECEVIIEDPATGKRHSFFGDTEAAALAAADAHFGVTEAETIQGQR